VHAQAANLENVWLHSTNGPLPRVADKVVEGWQARQPGVHGTVENPVPRNLVRQTLLGVVTSPARCWAIALLMVSLQVLRSTIGICCQRCSLTLSIVTAMWSALNRTAHPW
jgi:hypothetical protein